MIQVAIPSIVKNICKNIKFLQPLFESITNSLEANSTLIEIELYGSNVIGDDFEPSITGFSITDDGDGFDKSNLESFNTLWSDYKAEIGCKGSGRFTWLTVSLLQATSRKKTALFVLIFRNILTPTRIFLEKAKMIY